MVENTFSYWERTAFIDHADVIVIGSGLVGLSAALHLKNQRPALKVLVLERGFLPAGASTKNAGFACFGTISEQLAAINNSCEDEVLQMVDYKWRGLQRLRQNFGDKHINYVQHGGYELFRTTETENAANCHDHINYLNNLFAPVIGSPAIYAGANHKITEFGFKGVSQVIYNQFEGQIDTGKMMRALLMKAYEHDILVLNSCEIQKITQEGNAVSLVTSQGNFKAAKVILATNGFAGQLFPELNVTPGRGQVLVTKPIPGLKLKGTYHFDEGYYYFRNIDDRVLFGGGRNLDFATEATWDPGQTEIIKTQLTTHLKEMISPGREVEIDYWWSGIMGFGDSIMPIVKEVGPNVFCAVKCNGMGVAMGSLTGQEVADLVISAL